jgi:hypothetical protein
MLEGIFEPRGVADEAVYAKLKRRVNALRDTIAQACAEVGCVCLAQRLSPRQRSCEMLRQMGTGSLQVRETTALDLLPRLTQLAGALAQAGYYDTALECATMARYCEPILELDLARAYLHVVLGETEQARRIYGAILARHGSIPRGALQRLAELAQTHGEEDDIAELRDELASHAA